MSDQPAAQPANTGLQPPAPFVVIEGIDGAGTTTQARRLTARLRERVPVTLTHEPSDGPAGMLVRLALGRRLVGRGAAAREPFPSETPGEPSALDPRTIALLFAADRTDHLATRVEPNLRAGRMVVCDRYLLSSLAYQGIDLPLEWVLEINRFARVPDLTLYLDVPPEQAQSRMRDARWDRDIYEDDWHLGQVRRRYLELIAAGHPRIGPVVTLDGTASPGEVTERMLRELEPLPAREPRPAT